MTDDVLVAKIGGSTLGSHDTTLTDLAELQHRGVRSVVVHGGGSLINEWLTRHNIHTRFENGLRVTDEESLNVVVAVLAGLINKRIVASLTKLGARAVGMSGVDAGMIRAKLRDEKLGFVGDVTEVDSRNPGNRSDRPSLGGGPGDRSASEHQRGLNGRSDRRRTKGTLARVPDGRAGDTR